PLRQAPSVTPPCGGWGGSNLRPQPRDLGGGQFKLGAELPAVVGRHPADILGPDVQMREDRQADGPPGRVSDQPGQADPDMAVEELGPGRPRGGVVVLAGALDLRPIPLGGGVVDGEDQRRVRPRDREPLPEDAEQGPGEGRCLATDAAQEVVIALEVATGAAAAEPTGDGATTAGEEQPGAEPDESCLLAGVERQCQGRDP